MLIQSAGWMICTPGADAERAGVAIELQVQRPAWFLRKRDEIYKNVTLCDLMGCRPSQSSITDVEQFYTISISDRDSLSSALQARNEARWRASCMHATKPRITRRFITRERSIIREVRFRERRRAVEKSLPTPK
jgi:hypothetical protein